MAAKPSLAAQTGSLVTKELALPSVFQAAPEAIKSRFIAPYAVFSHPKRADEWRRITNEFKNVLEGELFLVRQDSVHKLDPMKAGWLCHYQYWAEANAAGEILRTSEKEAPRPFKEHVEAVVVVYLENELVPANIQFRSTKCPAAKAMSDALVAATQPSWGERSPEHRETLICNQPFMRFFGSITLGPPRQSKSTGLPYRPAQCDVRPTTIVEWRMLKAFQESENAQKALQDAADRFVWRKEEVQKKLVK
jgi:hypothetical protein